MGHSSVPSASGLPHWRRSALLETRPGSNAFVCDEESAAESLLAECVLQIQAFSFGEQTVSTLTLSNVCMLLALAAPEEDQK